MPEGYLLELWMEISNHPGKFFLTGEVKWCKEVEEGKRYLVGVELKERDTDDFKQWQEALGDSETSALGNLREA